MKSDGVKAAIKVYVKSNSVMTDIKVRACVCACVCVCVCVCSLTL